MSLQAHITPFFPSFCNQIHVCAPFLELSGVQLQSDQQGGK